MSIAFKPNRSTVIFVTAYDRKQSRAAAKRTGVVAFFPKPVDRETLLDAIAWAVEAARDAPSVEPKPILTTK